MWRALPLKEKRSQVTDPYALESDGLEDLEVYHVVPGNDRKEHCASALCWCEPEFDPDAPGLVYVHNALDGRDKRLH